VRLVYYLIDVLEQDHVIMDVKEKSMVNIVRIHALLIVNLKALD
jgi:hypothetical protein